MKKIFSITLVFILLIQAVAFAMPKELKVNIGFIDDAYGTSFYSSEDSYYNDGWHLIDDNGDGLYEYYYFTLSGHLLKSAIAPNGYQLNADGKLMINNILYQVSFGDLINSDTALFLNKQESIEEISKGLAIDYNQVFGKWYLESVNYVTNLLISISDKPSVKEVEAVHNAVSEKIAECKKIGVWYNDRIYSARKSGKIDRNISNTISLNLQKDMSLYVNTFREEMSKKINLMGY